MRRFVALALALCWALWGCAAPAGESERPGLLVAPDAAARQSLRAAVSGVLHGAPVTLADDAFTATSQLVIERTPARDAEGRRLTGRDLDRPQHFRLLARGARCWLIHEESGQRVEVADAVCRPAP